MQSSKQPLRLPQAPSSGNALSVPGPNSPSGPLVSPGAGRHSGRPHTHKALVVIGILIVIAIAYFVGQRLILAHRINADWHTASPSLAWADSQGTRAIVKSVATINAFFARARYEGAPKFADAALGWGSEWWIAEDNMPWSDGKNHAAFLAKSFGRDVFTAKELTQVTQDAITSYIQSRQGAENQMLVRIEQDLPSLHNSSGRPDPAKVARFQKQYASLFAHSGLEANRQAELQMADDISANILGFVGAAVAVDLGVATGILGTEAGIDSAGVAAGPETAGLSLVVCVAVTAVAEKTYNLVADPNGHITAKVRAELEKTRKLLIHGDAKHPGLVDILLAAEKSYEKKRRALIRTLLTRLEVNHG